MASHLQARKPPCPSQSATASRPDPYFWFISSRKTGAVPRSSPWHRSKLQSKRTSNSNLLVLRKTQPTPLELQRQPRISTCPEHPTETTAEPTESPKAHRPMIINNRSPIPSPHLTSRHVTSRHVTWRCKAVSKVAVPKTKVARPRFPSAGPKCRR
jgi:hypothetical protein